MFLSIIRDYDFSKGSFNNLSDIRGIVVIDEVDAHLHAIHQLEILPKLIKSFPNVQFVFTTHSPLFLIGMRNELGEDGFNLLEMPNGSTLQADYFSEFEEAYKAFRASNRHRDEIRKEVLASQMPLVFLEGDTDIDYVRCAASLLGRKDLLDKVRLCDGNGFGNLNKIWKNLDSPLGSTLSVKVLLVYDCDAGASDQDRPPHYKRALKHYLEHPLSKGIENLFPTNTILQVEERNSQFIDYKPATSVRTRGNTTVTPECRSLNENEKRNMCDWLCENGTAEDFANFNELLDAIEQVIED